MRYFVSLMFFVFAYSIAAQNTANLQFDNNQYDFGEISMEETLIVHQFKFVNAAKDSIRIISYEADCSCSLLKWPRHRIAPSDSGMIEFAFDAENYFGQFDKKVKMTLDDGNTYTLAISGKILPSDQKSEQIFIKKQADIGFRSTILNMGNMEQGGLISKTFAMHNFSKDTLSIPPDVLSPSFAFITFDDSVFSPGQTIFFELTLDMKEFNDIGFFNEPLELRWPNKVVQLSLYASVKSKQIVLSKEEWDKRPKIKLKSEYIDLGQLKSTDKKSYELEIENVGKSDLEIAKIFSNCRCFHIINAPTKIKPGEVGIVDLVLYADGRRGPQHAQLSIFSNDPQNQEYAILFKTFIKE